MLATVLKCLKEELTSIVLMVLWTLSLSLVRLSQMIQFPARVRLSDSLLVIATIMKQSLAIQFDRTSQVSLIRLASVK